MSTNWKCSCGAVFEPDMCCVCQEQRWIDEIDALRAKLQAAETRVEQLTKRLREPREHQLVTKPFHPVKWNWERQ